MRRPIFRSASPRVEDREDPRGAAGRRWRPVTGALSLLGLAALAACSESSDATGPAASALFSCVYGEAGVPETGAVIQANAFEAPSLCLAAPEEGAEYLLVPFHASESGSNRLSVEFSGSGSLTPSAFGVVTTGPDALDAQAEGALGGPGRRLAAAGPGVDWDFHRELREREARELTPLIAPARAARRQALAGGGPGPVSPTLGAISTAAAVEGDIVHLNAGTTCGSDDFRPGRVEAIGEHALVVADTMNPPGGFEAADWQHLAATFDTLVYPVTTEHFGERTDLDGNGRTVLFFTRAVNELTPAGSSVFIAGFFWAGDLFPRDAAVGLPGCPGSNVAEMFYLFVPDPTGEAGVPHSIEFARRIAVSVVGHEDQHLINAARRIYLSDAVDFEETWLNEALSHTAEELLFYAATPLGPGQDIGWSDILDGGLVERAFFSFAANNVSNYGRYLQSVEDQTPLGLDRIATRGAAWSLLRHLADHQERSHAAFFRDLAEGPASGLANLEDALGGGPLDRLAEWSVAVWADGLLPEVPPAFTHPSWNFRQLLNNFDGRPGFPLTVRGLPSGARHQVDLVGGTGTYVRFGVPPGRRAMVELSSGGNPPPARLRYALVRTK